MLERQDEARIDAEARREEEQARAEERDEANEERYRQQASQRSRLNEEQIFKRANPGDFQCPACKYITLLRDATRCPQCRASIPDSYWQREREKEVEAARLKRVAQAEWARGEPERQRRSKLAAEEAARKAATNRKAVWADSFGQVYLYYALPALTLGSALALAPIMDPAGFQARGGQMFGPEALAALVPFVNWLIIIGALFASDDRAVAWAILLGWGCVGGFIYFTNKYST